MHSLFSLLRIKMKLLTVLISNNKKNARKIILTMAVFALYLPL